MDFYHILKVETKDRNTKKDILEVTPDFQVLRSKDLMIRGKKFYAIWDEDEKLWSTDEYDVQRLVDQDVRRYADDVKAKNPATDVKVKTLSNFSTGLWNKFIQYSSNLSDNSHQLDEFVTFANSEVKKEDYVSKKLPYELSPGSTDAFDEILGTIYDPAERDKLVWSIGAILSGDARNIQKFIVLYGPAGAGKSTFLKIVEYLFTGYITTFEAKALTSSSNAFSTEVFRDNPLVAIQHDGDLSRIEDNTKLNSIVSHEDMTMNEKYKASYTSKINAFLYMGSNKAVKITDAKSGLIRRLIDVQPSGRRLPEKRYHALMFQIKMELGAIAYKCLEEYKAMGSDYYSDYRPVEMMLQTDVFFNFIDHYYDIFKDSEGIALTHAYTLYKQYCADALIEYRLPQYRFREELKNYFENFHERYESEDGTRHRSYYTGFVDEHFTSSTPETAPVLTPTALVLNETHSILDDLLADYPAQYSKTDGTPAKYWTNRERIIRGELRTPDPSSVCSTTLRDLDTSKEHYVKPPENHIVIDFDLKDETGEKSKKLNLEEAAKWPATYAEHSKGGSGVHLHYIFNGDASELSRIFAKDIEVKVFAGDSSLRRRVSFTNNLPVAAITSGLPLKEKKMISDKTIQTEKGLRSLIERNLLKEIHPGTKPSMDFIKKILDDAYEEGIQYDVSDMRGRILTFANQSTNQALYCIKLIKAMKFSGKEVAGEVSTDAGVMDVTDELVMFDCEVYPNLFVVNWKYYNRGGLESIVRMINPTPSEIEQLVKMKLVGYNCRRYDNHILYARMMGYTEYQLFELSSRIIGNDRTALFAQAYGLSYADILDFAATKQGLKKWQIALGIPHQEMDIPWDQPVPEKLIPKVLSYCDNDVMSTEAVMTHLMSDFRARQMMAELSGLPVNDPLQKHAAKIILLGDKNAKDSFVYTDLSETFPGYRYDFGKSSYKQFSEVGEGGFVYEETGMYENVAVLDVASMHPTSAIELNIFGEHTKNFKALIDARLAIKHGDFDTAKKMFEGRLAPFLGDEEEADKLSYALKIIINSIYGLTCASFDNPFRDRRNVDNIVAKRGALFMIDLLNFVQEQGYQVVHIKTDSIKIPNATPEIIDLVMEFGDKYGYTFEHEATYKKFCLVNKSTYIAYVAAGRKPAHWEAVGAEFKHPYVFKKLFTHEAIEHKDLTETKSVTTKMYLDYSDDTDTPMALMPEEVDTDSLKFVGKVGTFVPVSEGGGYLLREKEGKLHAVAGTKGHKWRETESVELTDSWQDVDYTYFNGLAEAALANIEKYGDFSQFAAEAA